jgi:hypothetical protein
LLFGIAICATGITNVYIGLRTYHERITKNVRLWTGLLTLEVFFLTSFYLMIDRWSYMMKQGQLPVEKLRTTDNGRTYPTTLRKELSMVQEWNLQIERQCTGWQDAVKFAEEDDSVAKMVGNLFGLRCALF